MTVATQNRFGSSRQRGYWLRCFLDRRIIWRSAFILILVATTIHVLGQVVEVPCNGSAAECAERHNELCKRLENSAANLVVPNRTHVWGLLIDPTGAPFEHPNAGLTVQLRDPKTAEVIASSPVSQMGTFGLGTVGQGAYRLIAVLLADGKATRFKGWTQPKGLACGDSDECTLAMSLGVGGTDNPIDFCPPK
jgi:hypothetical protein